MKTRWFVVFTLLMVIALLVFLLVNNRSATAQGTGTTERVSVASDGMEGNGWSQRPSISADGRYVVFDSSASNLVSGDTNGWNDVFVYDRQMGQTTRVSVASNGTQGNNWSGEPSISADGHYIAFYSSSSNLVSGDTNSVSDIFVRDRQTGQTTRVSVASDGTQGNGASWYPSISANGRYVAFRSGANNLVSNDSNNGADLFIHDRQTGQTALISIASDGTQGNEGVLPDTPSISTDGRYVAFSSSSSNLVSGDTNGVSDIFVRDRQTSQTSRVSVASDGTQGNDWTYHPSISGDGRYVAFYSFASNLINNDTNATLDVFVYDRQTGQTTRVSVASDGTQGNNGGSFPSISVDGRYVAFQSGSSNLVIGDTNGQPDIFVHDQETSQTSRVSVASGSTQANDYSNWPSISTGGRYVAFHSTADNLISNDTNNAIDVFIHDRGSSTTPTILVQDESSNPINGAQVYRNGNLVGTTSVTGTLTIPGLQVGDQLVARQRIAEFTTVKGNHNQDSSQNWAWRVYITSLDIPTIGEPSPFVVSNPTFTQTLTLKKNNALIGFNIVASVEWDANTNYLEELRQGFERASAYLYDATDGQMLFERVTIYDNAQYWADADYQIRASNQEWPRAHVGAILVSGDFHIFLGRYFNGSSSNQGAWTQPNAFRTQTHEFGHYGLNLYDSYFFRGNNGEPINSHCTSAAIRTNSDDHINATLMDFQFNATEFTMRGVNGLWTSQCEQTVQWQQNGESDWETIVKVYNDTDNPERWSLRTPAERGAVAAGPSTNPMVGWSTASIGNNANTGICASPPTYRATDGFNRPLAGVRVDLEKNGSVIHQGRTGNDGQITVLGAANGDTVVSGQIK